MEVCLECSDHRSYPLPVEWFGVLSLHDWWLQLYGGLWQLVTGAWWPGIRQSAYHTFRVTGASSLSSTRNQVTFHRPTGDIADLVILLHFFYMSIQFPSPICWKGLSFSHCMFWHLCQKWVGIVVCFFLSLLFCCSISVLESTVILFYH